MVRLLNQLLGVLQFSYQGILKRHKNKLTCWQINWDWATNHAPWHMVSLPSSHGIQIVEEQHIFTVAKNCVLSLSASLLVSLTFHCKSSLPHWSHLRITHLILQSRHSLFEMKLESLIGLRKELVHCLRQTLVVLLIHLLSLPCLYEQKNNILTR